MYSPKNTTVMFVGDITLAAARALVEKSFGSWNVAAPTLPALINKVRPVQANRIILVDRPNSVQSSIIVGQGTVGWESPDYFALEGTARVLGGGFGSRINMLAQTR